MAAKRKSHPKPHGPIAHPNGGGTVRTVGSPVFAQPQPTADPTTFRTRHPSDKDAYNAIAQLQKEHMIHATGFPAPRGVPEPKLALKDVFGGNTSAVNGITKRGQIVFHATGDCGSVVGPANQNQVADKMTSDFDEANQAEVPQFNLLLGDVVYSFGETAYYYDQFYEPYRDYPAPILAVAGNHDGMVAPQSGATSLDGFLRNFCADPAQGFTVLPEAGGLSRTAQIQPGVFYTFDAPFVRILALYSNSLEDPGVVADNAAVGQSQLAFLEAALTRVKTEGYAGALLFAHHHPPYAPGTSGSRHGGSPDMLSQMDQVCAKVGVWPHAVLAGHAHNYQRFTRTRPDGTQIPYVTCGNGGHNVTKLTRGGSPATRTPQVIIAGGRGADQVVFENYDDKNYGYLRVVVTAAQLRIEYHAASDGPTVKTPDDYVTVDLAKRALAHFVANDLGTPAAAADVRKRRKRPR
jgi:hypothetical protein